jgi:hypothetical protein
VKEKKHLERNLMMNEIFTEAVPTSLIMTFLMAVVWSGSSKEQRLIIGEYASDGYYLFFVAFTTSVLSAGLGLAKCLKVGPCRVLAEGGCLGGLLSPRFLHVFAACLLSLLGKGLALGSPFAVRVPAEQTVQVVVIIFATMFLPGFLLGVASCWHRGILKTFLAHPSILLMPAFTHFTFASSTKWCKGCSKEKEEDEEEGEQQEEAEEPFIIFSAKFSLLNLLISTLGIIGYCLSMTHMDTYIPRRYLDFYLYYSSSVINIPFIFVPILGLLLNLLFLALTLTNSCFTCFTCKAEFGALLPSRLHAHYVLDVNSMPVLVPEEEEEVRREETEMVELVAN